METGAALAYRRSELARCRTLTPGAALVDRPEVFGKFASATDPHTRLVVVDDGALPSLMATMRYASDGIVAVAETATACLTAVIAGVPGSPAVAMSLPDLRTMPTVPWPTGLRLAPVRRTPDDDPGGLSLADVVAILDTDGPGRPAARRGLVRGLAGPAATRVLAAVDEDGKIRATSAYGLFDGSAHVIFVNTHPAWRREGVGTAMTAAAVAAAAAEGATSACLDASTSGRGPYERLGFVAVLGAVRFARYPTDRAL